MRILPCCLASLLLLTAAAQADDACAAFKWSIAREKAWFAAAPQPIASGGGAVRINAGYAVALKPLAEAGFVKPPARASKPDTFGATLTGVTIEAPGLYDITLSGEGWIDAIQDGATLPTVDFSGIVGCDGVRKSVRYRLASGPLTVQISNAAEDRLLLAVATAP